MTAEKESDVVWWRRVGGSVELGGKLGFGDEAISRGRCLKSDFKQVKRPGRFEHPVTQFHRFAFLGKQADDPTRLAMLSIGMATFPGIPRALGLVFLVATRFTAGGT